MSRKGRAHRSPREFLKLLMVGDSGVGKTALMVQFCEETFDSTFIGTIGVDFKLKTLEIDGDYVKIQIWDTAGQERFRTITSSYYRGSDGIIISYDTTRGDTFYKVQDWLEEVGKYCDDVPRILVGNKVDYPPEEKVVSREDAQLFASQNGMPFFETSAKTGANVAEMFWAVSRLALERKVQKNAKTTGIQLEKSRKKTKFKCLLL